jgi:hypothetical protein
MATEDHERLADELAKEGDRLEHEGDKLERRIEQTRSDWRSKQQDAGVPGAVPPSDEDETDGDGDAEGSSSEDPPGPHSST